MRRLLIRQMVLVMMLLASGPADAERAFTLDNMLKVEGFGEAVFDPSGRWLVYEQVRPYDQFGDYSYRTYAFGKSGHQVWRLDLEASGPAALLPGIDPAPHTFIESFSPDGRYLALMQYASGRLTLGAYDMDAEVLKGFGPTPALSRGGEHVPVWISDHELAYAALPEGDQPAEASIRTRTGRRLAAAWEGAWRGDVVTADEVRSGGDGLPGDVAGAALVVADARTGEVHRLANGLFADLRQSPDGAWLAALAVSPGLEHGRLELFNLQTGERLAPAPGLDVSPYSLVWLPDSCGLAAFAWEAGSGAPQGRFFRIDRCEGKVEAYRQDGIVPVSERERGFVARPERAVSVAGGLAVYARRLDPDFAASGVFRPLGGAPPGSGAPTWWRLSAGAPPERLAAGLEAPGAVPWPDGAGTLLVTSADGVSRIGPGEAPERVAPFPSKIHLPARFSARRGVFRADGEGEAVIETRRSGRRAVRVLNGDPEGTAPLTLAFPSEGARLLAASSAARAALFRIDEDAGSQLVLVREARADAPLTVAHINGHLAGVDFGSWVASVSAGPEGGLVNCVLLPPGASRSKPLPVIVSLYPGLIPDCREARPAFGFADPHSPYLWNGLGYAYVRLALPLEQLKGDTGPMDGLDGLVERGLEGLIRDGIADPDRIALAGFSQGAATALLAAAGSPRVRAVIAINGFADYFSHNFGSAGVYSYTDGRTIGQEAVRYASGPESEYGLGASPFDDPQRYIRNSPVFLAPEIGAPVMLVHSDLDAFSMSQFDEMFGALRQAGGEARYVRYWGEGHGPSSPANIRDLWTRLRAFLEDSGVYPDPEENP